MRVFLCISSHFIFTFALPGLFVLRVPFERNRLYDYQVAFKYSNIMAADNPAIDTPQKRVWLKNLYFISRVLVIIALLV